MYSENLINCSYCFGCSNLTNKQYYIGNKPYEKEAYFLKKDEILKEKDKFEDWYVDVEQQ